MMNLFKKFMLIVLGVILGVVLLIMALQKKSESTEIVRETLAPGNGPVVSFDAALKTAGLTIGFSEDGSVLVETENVKVTAENKNGAFTLREADGKGRTNASVLVLLPKDTALDSFACSLGAGSLCVPEAPAADAVTIDVLVGNVDMGLASVPETMSVKMGTGNVTLSFPGDGPVKIRAPYALGGREFAERFIVTDDAPVVIDVSVGNTVLR